GRSPAGGPTSTEAPRAGASTSPGYGPHERGRRHGSASGRRRVGRAPSAILASRPSAGSSDGRGSGGSTTSTNGGATRPRRRWTLHQHFMPDPGSDGAGRWWEGAALRPRRRPSEGTLVLGFRLGPIS